VVIILVFGIPKAVLSYHGQSITPTTLDLITGTSLAIMYTFTLQLGGAGFVRLVMLTLRLYYLGLFQDSRPDICPNFFQLDLAPPILKFVCLSEGECSSVPPIATGPSLYSLTTSYVQSIFLFCRSYLYGRYWNCYDSCRTSEGVASLMPQAPHSPIIVRTTLVAGIVGLILGTFTTVQQFTKVVHLRGELHTLLWTVDVMNEES
jgi:hypothetical protein